MLIHRGARAARSLPHAEEGARSVRCLECGSTGRRRTVDVLHNAGEQQTVDKACADEERRSSVLCVVRVREDHGQVARRHPHDLPVRHLRAAGDDQADDVDEEIGQGETQDLTKDRVARFGRVALPVGCVRGECRARCSRREDHAHEEPCFLRAVYFARCGDDGAHTSPRLGEGERKHARRRDGEHDELDVDDAVPLVDVEREHRGVEAEEEKEAQHLGLTEGLSAGARGSKGPERNAPT